MNEVQLLKKEAMLTVVKICRELDINNEFKEPRVDEILFSEIQTRFPYDLKVDKLCPHLLKTSIISLLVLKMIERAGFWKENVDPLYRFIFTGSDDDAAKKIKNFIEGPENHIGFNTDEN